jgi:hypothetical protein
MLTLFFLGRDVEQWYGTKEFTKLYLVMLALGSFAWALINRLHGDDGVLLGASGAIAGVVVLYALNFPRRTLFVMFVIPMPAWLLGVLAVAYDIWGAMGRADEHVAYVVHLVGAAFAVLYYYQRWNFGRMFQGRFHWPTWPRRPPLRVHDPESNEDEGVPEEEVDRILEKIHREGEGSLTRKERRILENASREYQRRRKSGEEG